MRKATLTIIFLLTILNVTLQQLNVPLHFNRVDEPQQSKTLRHHQMSTQNPLKQHKVRSKITHNLNYIKTHFQQQNKAHKARSHQLKFENDNSHLKIETYNLQPTVYAFSLPLKVAGIQYKMSIDSGSSDIFIKGQNAAGIPKKRYQCGQQCIDNNDHFRIGYLDGRLQTYETKLQVEIGDHKFNESILVAYKVDKNFEQNQGLIGLSFKKIASNPNPTFLQTLKKKKVIDVLAFGVNLNFQEKENSFITFGSYDKQFFEGDLSYFPVSSQLFYYIKSQGVSFGDGDLLKVGTALLDTGNTCISIPHRYEGDILKQFNLGDGENENHCFFSVQNHAEMFSILRCKVNNFDALPVLKIHLGGKSYEIEKQFYLQACDRRPKEFEKEDGKTDGTWYCDTYIESVSGMSQLFLGDGFFNRYYTYFNLETNKIGIAKNKEVIALKKILKNQLDADKQDWQNILTKLNSNQSKQDIQNQVQQFLEQQEEQSSVQ